MYLARIGRPAILWSVYKFAGAIAKWTRACDKHLARLISYIHHTSDPRQYCHVENAAQHCRLGLFQDSDFAGDLEDSKSTSGGILCISGSRTFVLISWMCRKQTSVSHSSTESEVTSLDAGLRIDGISSLDLWHLVFEVLHSSENIPVRETRGETKPTANAPTPTPRRRNTATEMILNYLMWITSSQTQNLLTSNPCFTFEFFDALLQPFHSVQLTTPKPCRRGRCRKKNLKKRDVLWRNRNQ